MSGPRAARTRGGHVQTATRVYAHSTTGHRVVVVGTIHVGSVDYFDRLRALIDQLDADGAAVHYEFIRPATDEERATATAEEVEALDRFRVIGKSMRVLADLIALPTQHRWFPAPEHWRNVDVNDLDVVRAHPDRAFLGDLDRMVKTLGDADEDQRKVIRWLLRFMVRHLAGVGRLLRVLRALGVVKPSMLRDAFVIDHRNRLAVEAAIAETRPVVTVWGAGHLPGIHKLLEEAGYRMNQESWFVAIPRGEQPTTSTPVGAS